MEKSMCCNATMVIGGLQCENCGSNGLQESPATWGVQMGCPFCGDEYVHFNAPVLKISDEYTAWEGRGSAIRIPFWCEQGHSWYLRYGAHKGFVYTEVERVYNQNFSGEPPVIEM